MRNDLLLELSEILSNGNFKNNTRDNLTVEGKELKNVLIIEEDEISSDLACQHIQEFINEDIEENDGQWLMEYDLENINSLNKLIFEEKTILY